MDSLFGRSKKLTKAHRPSATGSELSERSVPYDRVGAGRAPVQVGTVSQGLRASGAISAPITNPTLTLDGTDLNLHTMARARHEREQTYGLPSTSSNEDSARDSTQGSGGIKMLRKRSGGESSFAASSSSAARRRGDSDATGPTTPYSGRGNLADFGTYPISPTSSSRSSNLPSNRSLASARPGEQSFGPEAGTPRYASSVLSNGSEAVSSMTSQLREHLPHSVRESLNHLRQSYYGVTGATTGPSGEFQLQRPESAEEIDAMFERVKSERDIGDAGNMTMDQKWGIVHAHEHDRWLQQKKRDAQMKRGAATASGQPTVFAKDTPEWYLKKFMDQTITAKHVGSLTVSLRTLPIDWMHHFIELQGNQVVARALGTISKKGSLRRNADVELEYELLKCLKLLLNYESGADDAVAHPSTINAIACSLSTMHIPSRRLVAEILTFLCYYNNGVAHESVLKAMDALSAENNETGRYDFWFQSLLATLSGRGKMGSLVGASQDVKKHGGHEATLTEYAQSNLILINGILTVDDFELRLHYRSQMEAAGLRKILDVCHQFQHDSLEKQIASYEKLAAADQEVLLQNFDQEVLRDLSDPYDVYRAIMSSVEGTPAYPYFLSSLQHLLLIRAEADTKTRYYQLIDELVTSIVLDKKQDFSGGLSSVVGVSVARLVAQFGEQERSRIAEEEASNARREANELRLQKEKLEEEIAAGGDGLVGMLKEKLSTAEEKLRVSRMTTDSLQARLAEQKRGYEEQIAQLELQIFELFRMIREGGISSRTTGTDGAVLDRNELITTLEKQMERRKTIGILEGRHRKKGGVGRGDAIAEEEEEDDTGGDMTLRSVPPIPGDLSRRAVTSSKNRRLKGPANAPLERSSQFMDAEDERERQHMEENLAKGTDMVYPHNSMQMAKSARNSPVRPGPSKLPGGSSARFLEDLKAKMAAGAGGAPTGVNGVGGRTATTESISEESNTLESSEYDMVRGSVFTDDTPPSSINGVDATRTMTGSMVEDTDTGANSGGMVNALANKLAQLRKPIDLS